MKENLNIYICIEQELTKIKTAFESRIETETHCHYYFGFRVTFEFNVAIHFICKFPKFSNTLIVFNVSGIIMSLFL
ncbi:unnamed protein product [Moneuplotes crassus]|uniref:Uncharacterized protein n=1 Tax=Euplotes crassus TaxID=5936 RepID=A0AAD2D7U3_EUPCR|nr:unnamed protein product [Moneuplotes crassus]